MPSVKQESPNQCTVTPYLKCFVQPEAPGTSCIGLNPGLCSHQESLIHIGKVKTELQPISPGGHNYVVVGPRQKPKRQASSVKKAHKKKGSAEAWRWYTVSVLVGFAEDITNDCFDLVILVLMWGYGNKTSSGSFLPSDLTMEMEPLPQTIV